MRGMKLVSVQTFLVILILLGIAWHFGNIALGGLLALLGLGGIHKIRTKEAGLKREADEHEAMSARLADKAANFQSGATRLDANIEKIMHSDVDDKKTIDKVVGHAKEDWS